VIPELLKPTGRTMQQAKYISKQAGPDGIISYTLQENEVWRDLYLRQQGIIQDRACKAFISGLDALAFSRERVPQLFEVNNTLKAMTGWTGEPVESVIHAYEFFSLLSDRKFPAANFIRNRDELDYLQEPDIFHELFGHCPLLSLKPYADFVENYGKMALKAEPWQRKYLFRLFWFTIEFGLIKTEQGLRIMGGGILSSYEETLGILEKPDASFAPFSVNLALRTPYRIDIIQPQYFVLESWDQLYDILGSSIFDEINIARKQGDILPRIIPQKEGHDVQFTN